MNVTRNLLGLALAGALSLGCVGCVSSQQQAEIQAQQFSNVVEALQESGSKFQAYAVLETQDFEAGLKEAVYMKPPVHGQLVIIWDTEPPAPTDDAPE